MRDNHRYGQGIRDQNGHTLTELMMVLGILGMLVLMAGLNGIRLSEKANRVTCEGECDRIFERILFHRDRTMMADRLQGDRIRFYRDSVHFGIYDSEKRYYRYQIVPLKTMTLQGNFVGKELVFHREGTVNIGGTLTFCHKGNPRRTLVVQPGTGRIYMKNE